MKRKLLVFMFAFLFALSSALVLVGCNNDDYVRYSQIDNVEADSVTNYWIEYTQGYTTHRLRTIAKATKNGVTYYYLDFTNNGNNDEMFVQVDANGSYHAYQWVTNRWESRESFGEGYGEGSSWFDFKTSFLSDYLSMAMVKLQYTGEVNSLIRHEEGTDVEDLGLTNWTTAGYSCGYEHAEHTVSPEVIENCHHFYDSEEDKHYYFAPETNFLLYLDGASYEYSCTTKVYKRSFNMADVLAKHDLTTAGLGFEELIV